MNILKQIGRNPRLDWIIIILLSVLVALLLAIQGLYLYNAVTMGSLQGTPDANVKQAKEFDEKTLSTVIERFSQREDISNKAKAGYSGAGDPSI